MRILTFLLVTTASFASSAQAQTIQMPSEIVEGNQVPVRVEGLAPGEKITLHLRRVTEEGRLATSSTVLDVGDDGILDPADDVAVSGAYLGVDAAGPFWSMRPEGLTDADRGTLKVAARRGDVLLAERTVRLLAMSPQISLEEIPEFVGARLYRPRGDRILPLIVVLGGSEGGSSFGRSFAPRLAELGYAALALPYHNPQWTGESLPGLPQAFADIPVDRLISVREWTKGRSDLSADQMAIYGVSKGGEFALLAAARFPWLRAVIGIVPSDVVWEGWGAAGPEGTRSSFAWQGVPLDFVPYSGMGEAIEALGRGEARSLAVPHLEGRRRNSDRAASARIPVERYEGPMLIAGGDRDTTWPSGEMVRAMAERRAEASLPTVAMSFADAGHGLAGTGWVPLNFARADTSVAANAAAQTVIWERTVRFLREHLGEGAEP